MDGLESKSQVLLQEDDEDFLVCDAIVSVLESFPEMDQQQTADMIKYDTFVVEYLRDKTMMSEDEVKSALESVRADAILRMGLFLNIP